MWQRFTEAARRVVFFAQEEAQRHGEGYVSTEHLLLGLCREEDSSAMRALQILGVTAATVREEVEKLIPTADVRPSQDMTLTPRAKRCIDLAFDESRSIGNNYLGTEHLLLGLLREGNGVAGRVLLGLGLELEALRKAVLKIQAAESSDAPPRSRPAQTFAPMHASLVSQFLNIRWRTFPLEVLALLLLADESPGIDRMLPATLVDLGTLTSDIEQALALAGKEVRKRQDPDQIGRVLQVAAREAGGQTIEPAHILLAIAQQPDNAISLSLERREVTVEQLRAALAER